LIHPKEKSCFEFNPLISQCLCVIELPVLIMKKKRRKAALFTRNSAAFHG